MINSRCKEKLKTLLDTYIKESDVYIAEFLASEIVPPDTSFEEAFRLYIDAMKRAEGDRFWTQKENETIEL